MNTISKTENQFLPVQSFFQSVVLKDCTAQPEPKIELALLSKKTTTQAWIIDLKHLIMPFSLEKNKPLLIRASIQAVHTQFQLAVLLSVVILSKTEVP